MAVYLWAVLHDRPVSWACDPANWPEGLWNRDLPSQSTMSRRLRTAEVQHLLHLLESRFKLRQPGSWACVIDGKPLVVGNHSKDSDATWGRGSRGFARGYKLHAIYGSGPLPIEWELTSLNVSEKEVAARLIPLLKRDSGYVLGDKFFDSNPLHELAAAAGCQLVAMRKLPGTKLGHRPHSAGRLRCIELLQTDFGKALYRTRTDVERQFGWLTNHGAGLAPLPAWVRGLPRVRLWVQAKLIIHACYVFLFHHHPPLAVA